MVLRGDDPSHHRFGVQTLRDEAGLRQDGLDALPFQVNIRANVALASTHGKSVLGRTVTVATHLG
jgi:hypothetical protein